MNYREFVVLFCVAASLFCLMFADPVVACVFSCTGLSLAFMKD